MSRRATRVDALLWALAAALLLAGLPVGRVSPDGLAQAELARQGSWTINPNHLLFEPVNAAWLALTRPLAPGTLPVDRLRRLSALCAAAALALFRCWVAPRLASSRAAANYGTAWCGLCAVFALLALSAETYILQLPAVVLAAGLLLRLRQRRSPRLAFALGAAVGAATLCFVSNLLLAPAAALAWLGSHEPTREGEERGRVVPWLAAGLVTVLAPSLWIAWRLAAPGVGLADWFGSYGGHHDLGRLRAVYGVLPTPGAIGAAALRALYGVTKTLVDLVPAVAQWRDGGERLWPLVRFAVAALAAWAVAGGARRGARAERRALLAVVCLTVPPALVFGWFWNNSDEQFYAPLAVGIGALAAQGGLRSRGAILCGTLALAWNATDVAARYVLYPRAARVAEVARLTADSQLVIYPGFDELQVLLALAQPAARPIALTTLAAAEPPASGLPRLRDEARAAVAAGGRVVCLDLDDRPPLEPPWKFLRALGYTPDAVRDALADLPFTGPARRSGLWTVRVAAPGGDTPDPP